MVTNIYLLNSVNKDINFSPSTIVIFFFLTFMLSAVLPNELVLLLLYQSGWDSGHNNLHVQCVDNRNLRERRKRQTDSIIK